ncbi:hypothetical protein CF335_g1811 [Tilletia laevis]|nr:hypothetical protein CF335_g1811 [Tilletia laevis]
MESLPLPTDPIRGGQLRRGIEPLCSQKCRHLDIICGLKPSLWFLEKLRNASSRNAHLTEDAEVQKVLDLGNFIEKEIETLYSLKKYRTMKRRYNPE